MRREADTSGRGARGRAAGLRGALRALAAAAVVALAAALALPAAAMAGGGQGGGAALEAGGAPALRASSEEAFYYLDENGGAAPVGEGYGTVSSSNRGATWGAGFHVVASDATLGGGVACEGDVKLVLCDGAKLTVEGGISVGAGASLAVYAGGGSQTIGGTGALEVAGSGGSDSSSGSNGSGGSGGDAIPGVSGGLTVYGGSVSVTGGRGGDGRTGGFAAGVDGGDGTGDGVSGDLTVHGGSVSVTGGFGGRGGDGGHGSAGGRGGDGDGTGVSGDLTVHGGSVSVTGGRGGIGGDGGWDDGDGGDGGDGGGDGVSGDLTVHGGSVSVSGGFGGMAGDSGIGSSVDGGNGGRGLADGKVVIYESPWTGQQGDGQSWTALASGSGSTALSVKVTFPIEITSASNKWTYDGAAHIKHEYDVGFSETSQAVTVAEGETAARVILPTNDALVITPTAGGVRNFTDSARGNNAFTYAFTGDGGDVSRRYPDVTASFGTLSIDKRKVTLTSACDSKVYDGAPLTNGEVGVSGDGFASGEGASYDVTGTRTDVGDSPNEFTYTLDEGTKEENYSITTTTGTLTVSKVPTEIVITAGSSSKVYDGEPLKEDAYTYTKGVLAGNDVLTATVEGAITGAGTEANKVTAYKVMRGDVDATANYTFGASVDGALEVTPKAATITVSSASKVYGEADPELTGKVEGLVKAGDLGVVRYVRENSDVEAAGTYAGVLSATYEANANYDVSVAKGDFKIRELYTLAWLDGDGSVLQSKGYAEGDEPPAYDGKTPTKAADARRTYTFSGWDGGAADGTVTTYRPLFNISAIKFAPSAAAMAANGKRGVTVAWASVEDADGYDVFFARCNHGKMKVATKKVATVKANGKLVWKKGALKPHTAYKARVKAYAMIGDKKTYISSSPLLHLYTSGGTKRFTNAKRVKVNRRAATLSPGGTLRLKARVVKQDKSRKLFPKGHVAAVRYLSSDTSVATVSAKGKIRARSKGECTVYVYAHSGIYKKVKVEVG